MLCSPFFHWILLWWMWTCPDMLFEIPSWWRHLTSLNVILSFYGEKVLKSADVSKNERWWWKYEPYFWLAWPFTYQMTPKASYKCFFYWKGLLIAKFLLIFSNLGQFPWKSADVSKNYADFELFCGIILKLHTVGLIMCSIGFITQLSQKLSRGGSFTPPPTI